MKKETMIEWMTEGHISIPKVLFKHYTDIGLNEEECMLLLHVNAFIEEGNHFPTPEELSGKMTASSEKCSGLLRRLIHKGVLSLEQHKDKANGVYSESYSLVPLWEKLLYYYFQTAQDKPDKQNQDLFTMFEREFGRPLSPIEIEQMSMWMDDDDHSDDLIKMALKEAVMAGIMNFRYIDRILLGWKKNGIKTPEQAKVYGEKFHRNRHKKNETEDQKEPFPFYNWLEN
ncbi:MAG TPA: DnaD domain-containing protein [Bacillales bacterium]|nr:DnaD domain-containing protein [Bacillales bacterium]